MKYGFPTDVESIIQDALLFFEGSGTKTNRDYIDIYVFQQWWPNGLGGLDGIRGQITTQAFVQAYTFVISDDLIPERHRVYFSGKFAYNIDDANVLFYEDLHNHMLKSVKHSNYGKLYERE